MGNAIDTVLNCGNRADELRAKEAELKEAELRVEEFKCEAERYKRQLDEILANKSNGILKKSESCRSISKRISFDTDGDSADWSKDKADPVKSEKKSFVSSLFSRSSKKQKGDDHSSSASASPMASPRHTPLPSPRLS